MVGPKSSRGSAQTEHGIDIERKGRARLSWQWRSADHLIEHGGQSITMNAKMRKAHEGRLSTWESFASLVGFAAFVKALSL